MSVTQIGTTTPAAGAVNNVSDAVAAMRPAWSLATALLGGTYAMRSAGQTYLPMWPNEEPEEYDKRLKASTLFPAFGRTVFTLAARPFSKPITLEVPRAMEPWLENADLQGRNLDAVAATLFPAVLGHGFAGIMVDHPKNPGLRTAAEEKQAGMRPYMVPVYAEQILGWRSDNANGVVRLTQLRILESAELPYGEWGTQTVWQVRVLFVGGWQVYRQAVNASTRSAGNWALFEEGKTTLTRIPFVPIYGERTGFMTSRPPLLELAHLNVKHWQSQSDQDYLLHVARVPILTATGVDSTTFKLTVGGSAAIVLPEGASMAYVEHTGSALGAGKTSLDDLKEEMRQSGAELLVLRPGPATATEVASDNAVGMCALQEVTATTEDAIDDALSIMAEFGQLDQGGKATLFKDFGAATLAEASAQLLVGMNSSGSLSGETLVAELKRRGILSADVTWEEEQDRLASEGPPVGKIDPLTGLPYDRPVPPEPNGGKVAA